MTPFPPRRNSRQARCSTRLTTSLFISSLWIGAGIAALALVGLAWQKDARSGLPWLLRLYRVLTGAAFVRAPTAKPDPARALVWIHGASIGEGRVALSFALRCLALQPHAHALVTVRTASALAVVGDLARQAGHARLLGVVRAPIDLIWSVRRFLAHWRPCMVVLVESELWPNLICESVRAGARVALVNATLSERSLRRWLWCAAGREAVRHLLCCLCRMAVQAGEAARRYSALVGPHGGCAMTTCPSFKWLQVSAHATSAASAPALAALLARRQVGRASVWLAACTHADEEALVLEVHAVLAAERPNLLTIVAPRHPVVRTAPLRAACVARGQPVVTLSELAMGAAHEACKRQGSLVVLIDGIGLLASVYALRVATLMGGSFAAGAHNPLEPLAAGCPTLVGPAHGSAETLLVDARAHGALGAHVHCCDSRDARSVAQALGGMMSHVEQLGDAVANATSAAARVMHERLDCEIRALLIARELAS